MREEQLLRAVAAAGLPATALAIRLDRPADQVRRRCRDLLGPASSPRAYTAADDAAIRSHWQLDASPGRGGLERLAEDLGRSPGSVRLRAEKLGIHRPPRRTRWRDYEDAAVRDGYQHGLTCARIATELPCRSAVAVAARAAKLGLTDHARIWRPTDDLALHALVRNDDDVEAAARLLARTPDALRARTRKLGLTPLRSPRSHRGSRPWTPAEDEQLRLHAALNPATLADWLDRSPEAITRRLRRLGLRAERENSPHHPVSARDGFTPGEHTTLTRELQAGGPRRRLALAQRLGRPPAQIPRSPPSTARRSRTPGSNLATPRSLPRPEQRDPV